MAAAEYSYRVLFSAITSTREYIQNVHISRFDPVDGSIILSKYMKCANAIGGFNMGAFYRKNKLFASKTLTKMIISYFVIILFSISMISVVLYYKFSTATIEDIRINMQEKLAQNMNQLEQIRNQVNALGLQLISDSVLVDAMYKIDEDVVAKYLSTRKLTQVRDAYPMIHSVYVYNSKSKQFISNFGSSTNPTDGEMELLTRNYKNRDQFQFIPLSYTFKNKKGDQVKESIVSFIFSDTIQVYDSKQMDENSSMESSIIINLKAEYIQNSFTALGYSNNSDMYLLNKKGDVICDSNLKYFGKNIKNIDYIGTILKSNSKAGYSIKNDEKDKALITYYKSDALPFIFINRSNYTALLEKVYILRNTIFIICILIFLTCIIMAILSAYNVYLPFGKLIKNIKWQLPLENDSMQDKRTYNEVDYLTKAFSNIITKTNELETSRQENIPLLKKMCLKGLIEGDVTYLKDVSKKITDLQFNIPSERVCVVLFSIDGYAKLSRLEGGLAQYNIKFNIESCISCNISDPFKIELVDLEEDLIAVIINVSKENQFINAITPRIKEIQANILDKLGVTVTAVIGSVVDKLESINLSYCNCLEVLKYRFVYGYDSILDNNLIKMSVNKKYTSIEKEKKKILQSIRVCDKKEMKAEVNEIINMITDNQYDYIKLTINQLTLDIMKTVESLLGAQDYEIDFNNIYSDLNNIDTLTDVKDWFILYCEGIIQKLESKKDNKHKDMINIARGYLKDNFHKPEMSTELLAETVNLTPGYFGKLFYEYTQKSVNEYIIDLRMGKAIELLETSGDSINNIAMKVGYSNQSYFTSIFRKHFSVTPNEYRIDFRKANPTIK